MRCAKEVSERLLRHLATMNALRETAADTYALTDLTSSMGQSGMSSTIPFL